MSKKFFNFEEDLEKDLEKDIQEEESGDDSSSSSDVVDDTADPDVSAKSEMSENLESIDDDSSSGTDETGKEESETDDLDIEDLDIEDINKYISTVSEDDQKIKEIIISTNGLSPAAIKKAEMGNFDDLFLLEKVDINTNDYKATKYLATIFYELKIFKINPVTAYVLAKMYMTKARLGVMYSNDVEIILKLLSKRVDESS